MTELPAPSVAIVTGGSSPGGRAVARGLADWRWAIVVVYLEDQRSVEATIVEIIAAGGTIVAVRADLADDLDVQRLFAESEAAFGDVDVVAHTTVERGALLYAHAARRVSSGGILVTVATADPVDPGVAHRLRERGVCVGRAPPEGLIAVLDRWRRRV